MTTHRWTWRGLPIAVALLLMFGGVAPVEAGDQAPATAQHGSELFHLYCASCHGKTAQGDGPLANSMRRKPPNLTEILARNKGAFPKEMVYRIIDGRERVPGHGGPDMPVWGDAFLRSGESSTEDRVRQRIQSLVEFLDSIQKQKTP